MAEDLEKYLILMEEGRLSDDDLKILTDMLRGNPENRKKFVEFQMMSESIARSLNQKEGSFRQVSGSAAQANGGRWVLPAITALAASLLVALGVWLFSPASDNQRSTAVARIDKCNGAFAVEGSQRTVLKQGDLVKQGAKIITGNGGAAGLVWLNQTTTVELASDSTLTVVDSAVVGLDTGRLNAGVAKQAQGHSFLLRTPHGVVTILGTRLTLSVMDGVESRLDMREGVARLSNLSGSNSVEVRAGEYAVAEAGGRVLKGPTDERLALYRFEQKSGSEVRNLISRGPDTMPDLRIGNGGMIALLPDGIRIEGKAEISAVDSAGALERAWVRNGGITVSFWFRYPADRESDGLPAGSSHVLCQFRRAGSLFSFMSSSPKEDERGRIHLSTVVFSNKTGGAEAKYYGNGVEKSSTGNKQFGSLMQKGMQFAVAPSDLAGNEALWKSYDALSVVIYGRPLSPSEIRREYDVGPPVPPFQVPSAEQSR